MTLWNMAKNMVNNKNKIKNHQFQVGYISNTGMNIKKTFREQVENNLALLFEKKPHEISFEER